MRRALSLLIIAPCVAFAATDEFFVETFDQPVARSDAGGRWTEIYDVASTRTVSGAGAHRGAGGITFTRNLGVVTTGTDTQLEWVSSQSSRGDSWLRWWMRTRVTMASPQQLIGFGDTIVPNHLGIAYDPAGLFLTGFDGTGQYFNPRAANVPDSNWHLYEIFLRGMGSNDSGVTVIIDGTNALDYGVGFDFPDSGVRQINVGYTYGAPRTLLGSVDFDDVRGSLTRPAGIARISGVNGPWYADTCIQLRVDFATSDRSQQQPLFDTNTITLASVPGGTFYSDSNCSQPLPISFPADAGTMVINAWFRASSAANYFLTASASDLLPGLGSLSVQPAMDAGFDAGFDAGTDAGIDAGMVDAGLDDAGVEDAGMVAADAGSSSSDGGVSSVTPDAGTVDDPRELMVGCGCTSAPWPLVLLALAALRMRRSIRKK